jgi:hypothetical protein
MQVAKPPVGADDLAEQECAPVPEAGCESTELVPGVRLGHRSRLTGDVRAGQQPEAFGSPQPCTIEAQLHGQRLVQHQ